MQNRDPERPVRHLQSLYTVVVGLALTVAITGLIDQQASLPIRLTVLPYFIAYLCTLVPFYHGALRHLDVTYLEEGRGHVRSGALMADWSLLFLESCLFLGMAALLQRGQVFLYALIALLVFDAVWGFVAHLAFSPSGAAERKWAGLNFVAVLVLIVIAILLDALEGTTRPVATYRSVLVVTIAFARTVIDYWLCWDYYYPA
jgi:hypothetical protein